MIAKGVCSIIDFCDGLAGEGGMPDGETLVGQR